MAWSDAARRAAAEARRRHGTAMKVGAGTSTVGGYRLVLTRARTMREGFRRADKTIALRAARETTGAPGKGSVRAAQHFYKSLRMAKR